MKKIQIYSWSKEKKVRKKSNIFKKIVHCMIVSAILLIGGCGSESKTKETLKDKIVIAHESDINSLTPLTHNLVSSSRVDEIMYNKLFKYGDTGEIIPVLAESYRYIDDNTLEIKIKKGVKFHNGDILTANDVAFTFKFWRDAKIRAHMIEAIDTVTASDSETVVITTKYPFAPLMGNIVAMGHIVNERNITTNPNWKSEPVGTGPYKFVSWTPGDNLTIEAFDGYFEGKPSIKTIVYKAVPEGGARTMGLEAGDYDVIIDVEPVDKTTISNNDKLVYNEISSVRPTYLIFNMQNEKYSNKKVREAIEYAIDKEALIKVVLEGNGIVADTMIPEQIFGSNRDIKSKKQDYTKAKELLIEANYPTGFKTVITSTNKAPYNKLSELLQANLKEIGIDATIETYDWAAFVERTGKGQYEISTIGWSNGTGDPDYSLYPLLHSASLGSAGNRSYFVNKEFDSIVDQGRRTIDPNKRLLIYHEAQEFISDNVVVIPLFYGTANIAYNKNIEGIKLDPAGRHEFKYMKIKN